MVADEDAAIVAEIRRQAWDLVNTALVQLHASGTVLGVAVDLLSGLDDEGTQGDRTRLLLVDIRRRTHELALSMERAVGGISQHR